MFKAKKYDIILLQETHCRSVTDQNLWEKAWEGKIIGSFGDIRSRGVAILISERLKNYSVDYVHRDNEGRLLVADLSYNNTVQHDFYNRNEIRCC